MTTSRCLCLALAVFSIGCGPIAVSPDGRPDGQPDGQPDGADATSPRDVTSPLIDVPAPIDSGVTCRTTGGRVLRPGESVSDGCNTCVCQPTGTLACTNLLCGDAMPPPPPPDAGMCVAPDGTPLRPGESWSETCTGCLCLSGGILTCFPTCFDGGALLDTGAACNAVSLVGVAPPPTRAVSSLPVATGGTVVDGRYELTDLAMIVPPGVPLGPSGRLVMEFGGGLVQFASESSGIMGRFTFSSTTAGTTLALRGRCGVPEGPLVYEYSASATTLVLQIAVPGGAPVGQMTLTRR